MKVGSPDPQDDVLRARAIREEIGDDNFLMMDANQKWDVLPPPNKRQRDTERDTHREIQRDRETEIQRHRETPFGIGFLYCFGCCSEVVVPPEQVPEAIECMKMLAPYAI